MSDAWVAFVMGACALFVACTAIMANHISTDHDVWNAMRMCPPGMTAKYDGSEMTGCVQLTPGVGH